jgi:hypothetical protein
VCPEYSYLYKNLGRKSELHFAILQNISISKMAVFWVVESCSLVAVSRCFRGLSCFHHQDDSSASVDFCYSILRYKSEDSLLQARPRENLNSYLQINKMYQILRTPLSSHYAGGVNGLLLAGGEIQYISQGLIYSQRKVIKLSFLKKLRGKPFLLLQRLQTK